MRRRYFDLSGLDAGENGVYVLTQGRELDLPGRIGRRPLLQQFARIFLDCGRRGVIVTSSQHESWRTGGRDGLFGLELLFQLLQFFCRKRLLAGKDRLRLTVVPGAQRQNLRSIWRYRPEQSFAGWVLSRVNHRVQSEAGDDLRHRSEEHTSEL